MPSSACDWSSDVCSRSEEHTSELQSHSEISYPVFCLKKKKERHPDRAVLAHPANWQARPAGRRRAGARSGKVQNLRHARERGGGFFFFNDTATTEIYTNLNTLSLHDALPI